MLAAGQSNVSQYVCLSTSTESLQQRSANISVQ
jgi:hypothetical protein